VAAGRVRLLEVFLWPFVVTVKAVPVASFIIISLIWLSSRQLSVFISFLMVFPVIYLNVLQGIRSADAQLLEMAAVFRVPWSRRLPYIYLPQIRPFLSSACSVSLGMSWKAGIAAEIIGIPDGSIGEKLYSAKIYLNTADLFAWTVVVVLISVLFEKLFLLLLNRGFGRLEKL
jgi:NitT/TauT family transport system permease protein